MLPTGTYHIHFLMTWTTYQILITKLYIITTCKENIHCKNVTIRTKDMPCMCNKIRLFFRKETDSLNVVKELYQHKTNSTFILLDGKQTGLFEMQKGYESKDVESLSDPNLNIRKKMENSQTYFR